jgi:Rps23 Pro-64 3,4-dihydroxylase Tpa1-like proline 4-hydroxylase
MIKIFDNFFTEDEFNIIYSSSIHAPYYYGELDCDGVPPTGMISDLKEDMDAYNIILNKILSLNNKLDKEKVYRVYINCFAPMEHPHFHCDCDQNVVGITFLYYLNKIWHIDDGGETQFLMNDQITGVLPLPNRMIAFDSRILHKATSFKNKHRFSIAIKFDQDYSIL